MLPRKFYFDNTLDQFFEDEGAKMKCDIYQKSNTYHVENICILERKFF